MASVRDESSGRSRTISAFDTTGYRYLFSNTMIQHLPFR